MPELPEVETIKRALKAHLPGKRIERILVRESRLRWLVQENRLKQLVEGQEISDINRRAKYLLIRLSNESTLIMHLGMSGQILMLTETEPFDKHDHVIFYFNDQSELRFRDTRRFGMIDAITPQQLEKYPRFVNLGFEPLAADTSPELLFEKARNLKKPVKNLLMDANFIVGVGNIYASEALYYAGIHPAKPSNQLSLTQWQRLLNELRNVLNNAIKKGGTTLKDYVNTNGEMGYFQLSLAVYGREGENCRKCDSIIVKYRQVGRSTFYCPKCQSSKNSKQY